MNGLITSHSSMTKELPLIHTSRRQYHPSIISTGSRQPRRCEVFKESLVYLFYGGNPIGREALPFVPVAYGLSQLGLAIPSVNTPEISPLPPLRRRPFIDYEDM